MASKTISIRLSAAERQTLAARAKADGRPLSQWLRLAALNAAGGVSSEWDAAASPAWAKKLSRVLLRAVRHELKSTRTRR